MPSSPPRDRSGAIAPARSVSAARARSLSDLRGRLRLLVRSMTWQGPVVGPAEEASWVEALAWFGGWDDLRSAAEADAGEAGP